MQHKNFVVLAGSLLLSALPLLGQDPATISNPTEGPKMGWQWSTAIDGYSSGNLTDLGSGTNNLRSFDGHSNTFRVNVAGLGLDYNTPHWGAHMDAGYGDEYRSMMSTDRLRSPNSYIPQL